MDESVIAAIKRWPNVPVVYGWLSLTARGQWRLHGDGGAAQGGAGDSISNPQILAFINRNYGCDEKGRWFFQNGPQRVYVRLDAAPWILSADDSQGTLTTHTGLSVESITNLWIDDLGRLYLQSEHGPGMLIDRDLPRFTQSLVTEDGQSIEDWWGSFDATTHKTGANHITLNMLGPPWRACPNTLTLTRLKTELEPSLVVQTELGFVANPTA